MTPEQFFYVEYIRQYVKLLTEDRKEFFLSLCDIEEELLKELEMPSLDDYQVVVVDHKDYSQAVRMRNDAEVNRIVLLSGEGVKQIDSLKDFNEYSIFSRDREQIWACLEKVFNIRLGLYVKTFLGILLEQRGISFWDFLQYICKAYTRKGYLRAGSLNRNLPMLGIWKSRESELLKKGKLRKMIRLSKYAVVENRLTRAILNHQIADPKKQSLIINSLSQGNIQRILENLYFEDMEEFLKNAPKSLSEKEAESTGAEENADSKIYDGFSYEFMLWEDYRGSINDIEKEWTAERRKEDPAVELNWGKYSPQPGILFLIGGQFEKLREEIEELNLSRDKIDELLNRYKLLWESFNNSWNDVLKATPICLNSFCQAAGNYTQTYFDLLSFLITDEKVRYAMTRTKIIPLLQTLFCRTEEKEIRMPFYHPVCVYYYMGIREMYEYALQRKSLTEPLKMDVIEALIHKVGMQFPIDFLECEGRQYALDFTTVWKSGEVLFQNREESVVYSVLDFRIIHRQIVDYVEKHRFLTDITIALIDINDLGGLIQLTDRIRQISQGNYCNIGHITFLILSSKEEELKRKLAQMWDVIGINDMVRFRFGRAGYRIKTGNGRVQYDIDRIMEEADMTVIADGSVLYYPPKLARLQKNENMIRNRLEKTDIWEQVQRYFRYGKSDMITLWDTLQGVAGEWDVGLWRWKSKEIDNSILAAINQKVSQNAGKRIVALSSNRHILSEIFRTDYMQAYQQKYNGKNITLIQFDRENQVHSLPKEGRHEIIYSLNEFYSSTLEIEEFSQKLLPDSVDIIMQISYQNGKFFCCCNVYKEDPEEEEETQKTYENFLFWQIDAFLKEEHILADYMAEVFTNYWYEEAKSISAVLMIKKLCMGGRLLLYHRLRNSQEYVGISRKEAVRDCMEVSKIHEMLSFIEDREVVDEYTVRQFQEKFEVAMLNRVLESDRQQFLEEEEREKLSEIYRRAGGG